MNHRHRRSEAGSASLDLVAVFPIVLFALAALVQGSLWAHGNHVLDGAAREGARAARLWGDANAGRERAEAFLTRHGNGVVTGTAVEVRVEADVARVTVRGRAVPILPGVTLPLRAMSSGEVERFVPAAVTP